MRSAFSKIWMAAKTERVGPVLGWNLPLALACFGYFLAIQKLIFLQTFGFTILLWNEKTERAMGATLWLRDHLWLFLAVAVASNCVYLFCPKRGLSSWFRRVALTAMALCALWYFELGSYLSGKVIGSLPNDQTAATESTKPH